MVEAVQSALAAAEAIQDDEESKAQALSWLAEALAQLGDRTGLQRVLEAAKTIGDDVLKFQTLQDIARAFSQTGDQAGLRQTVVAVETITDELGKAQALVQLANLLAQTGEQELLSDAAQQALSHAESIQGDWSKSHALTGLAEALVLAGSLESLTRLRAIAESILDPKEKTEAWIHMGSELVHAGQTELAHEFAQSALRSVEAIQDEDEQAEVLGELSMLLFELGNRDDVWHILARVRLYQDREKQVQALQNLALTIAQAGEMEQAVRAISWALEISQSLPHDWEKVLLLRAAARVQTQASDSDGIQRTLDIALSIPDMEQRTTALSMIAAEILQEGQSSQSAQVAWLALQSADNVRDVDAIAGSLGEIAGVLAEAGEKSLAAKAASRALRAGGSIPIGPDKAQLLSEMAQALAAAGELSLASQAAQHALSIAVNLSDLDQVDALRQTAGVLVQLGDHNGLKQSLAAVEAMPEGMNQAQALGDIAAALARSDSISELQHALVVAESFDDIALKIEALNGVSLALARAGEIEHAARIARQNLLDADALPSGPTLLSAICQTAAALIQAGETEQATHAAMRALSIVEEIEMDWEKNFSLQNVAEILALAEAHEGLYQALAIAESITPYAYKLEALGTVCVALAKVKDLDRLGPILEGIQSYPDNWEKF